MIKRSNSIVTPFHWIRGNRCARVQLLPAYRSLLTVVILLLTANCSLLTGCRRDMQDQPKAIAYRENSFFKDGTGSRPLVEGTVPRGYLREDRAYFFGKKLKASDLHAEQKNLQTPSSTPSNGNANAFPDDVDMIPMPLT